MDEHAERPESDVALPSPPSAAEEAQAENLIRQAMVARRRGDRYTEHKLLADALAAAPGSLFVLETVGDDLFARQKYSDAKKQFETALALFPGNVAIERKVADCVYFMSAAAVPELFREKLDTGVSPKSALVLSILLPGLGQLLSGSTQKGAWMLGGWVVGLIYALLIPDGMRGVFGLFGARTGASFNVAIMIPLAMMSLFHLWSIFDAATHAKADAKPLRPTRPIPPVDQDFEL